MWRVREGWTEGWREACDVTKGRMLQVQSSTMSLHVTGWRRDDSAHAMTCSTVSTGRREDHAASDNWWGEGEGCMVG